MNNAANLQLITIIKQKAGNKACAMVMGSGYIFHAKNSDVSIK